ncbi:MAG: sensor domain-containing diguanylate cyclase [Coxiellaceae bacterium]|nr:sensor domain-containing diguanylate cyclase [Coxiellaceae bacterium]
MKEPISRLGDLINLNIFQNINDAVMVFNADYRIIAVNPAFETLTGYAASEVLGGSPQLLQPNQNKSVYLQQIQKWVESQGYWSGPLWQRHKNGTVFTSRYRIQQVQDPSSMSFCYVVIISLQTNQMRFYDPLTSLPASDLLQELLQRQLLALTRTQFDQSKCHRASLGQHLACAVFDVRGLGLMNHTHGYPVGDQVLIQVVQRICAIIRETDIVGRWVRGRFVVILPAFRALTNARELLYRLSREVNGEYLVDNQAIPVQCLIGVSLAPDDARDGQLLLAHAEKAITSIKSNMSTTTIQFYQDICESRSTES